ncbi:MAG: A/G-specific adenine glycosylase, partial [Minisyncoccia bacterium]
MSSTSFKRKVWAHYKKEGRHNLPWRKTRDPYKILVSEVMLQQTQVERVIPFYTEFTKRWPSFGALADAPLAEVLKAWQGLGYNRRAKMLRAAAKEIIERLGGKFPKTAEELDRLPGIGHYTANAIAAFAFTRDAVFIETNIRTAILYNFFAGKKKVSDTQIRRILEELLPRGKSRVWNLALMDYGAHLKKSGVKLNAKSRHYSRQSKFAGSNR